MEYILKGGRVIDPVSKLEKDWDVRVQNGRICEIGADLQADGIDSYDLTNMIIAPGFIDMHVHLREPGGEAHETIETGCRAAASGGFTTIAVMPNTKPCADNEAVIELVKARSTRVGLVNVLPIGTITKGQQGEEIAEIGSLFQAGAVAVSDDGRPVMNSEVMRRALEYTQLFNIPVISHCEELTLAAGGAMNEGYWATVLGLKGIPAQAEEIMVARDILLAQLTGGRLHIAHVSTKGSIALLKFAKEQGIKVTAEATPHHLLLADETVQGYGTSAKVNPPLRTKEDIAALRLAVKEGLVTCIVTDHAPWSQEEKEQEFSKAPNGISGLETAVPICWDTLVKSGLLTPSQLIERFTKGPAAVLNLDKGYLEVGKEADITVIDPQLVKKVEAKNFYSKGKNTPVDGKKFQGWPVMTIVNGKIIMHDGQIKEDTLY